MKIPAIPSIRPNSHDATIHVPISRLLPDKNVPTYRYSQSNEITSPLQPSSSSALHNISNNGNLNGNEVRTKLRLRTATFRSIMTRFFTSLHFSVNAGRHHFYHYHSRLVSKSSMNFNLGYLINPLIQHQGILSLFHNNRSNF